MKNQSPEVQKKVVAILYPPSGKEVHFDDGSWTNIGSETKNYPDTMTPNKQQGQKKDETEKCHLEYIDGYLTCTFHHTLGALCLGNKCEYCRKVECECYKQLIFETREEAREYYFNKILPLENKISKRTADILLNNWLSEENVIIKSEVKKQ